MRFKEEIFRVISSPETAGDRSKWRHLRDKIADIAR
jgi:hypothetical protein